MFFIFGILLTTSLPGRLLFSFCFFLKNYFCINSTLNDIASGSEITPCNKIDKPLVVYRFSGNVMTSITPLRT